MNYKKSGILNTNTDASLAGIIVGLIVYHLFISLSTNTNSIANLIFINPLLPLFLITIYFKYLIAFCLAITLGLIIWNARSKQGVLIKTLAVNLAVFLPTFAGFFVVYIFCVALVYLPYYAFEIFFYT